ncbi:uncharacterized protein LOC110819138 [Carica papaya]|uniref:uncharacterized protein LOC110819138 n=1 Tax=Carica papaya TaxID=3649 RepID=UPI000B8CD958|nr:uncharacterized protein LOC110819138 [Carica papaya]
MAFSHPQTHHLLLPSSSKHVGMAAATPSNLKLRVHQRGFPVGCLSMDSGAVVELERELKAEILNPEEEQELMKAGDKCRERKGVVALLECLEMEAIMGGDQGKNPSDYNRRARIFDKSSRVFQALKQLQNKTAV